MAVGVEQNELIVNINADDFECFSNEQKLNQDRERGDKAISLNRRPIRRLIL